MISKKIWSPAGHSPVFCVCSHTSGHGVAAAVVAVKFSSAVSSFPEPVLAASIGVVADGLAACWITLHSFIAFVMLT